ncbi:MAG: hypothetical protein QUS13_15130 [Smithella sp.]|nr:hypothetical protein [Smithella sp.]
MLKIILLILVILYIFSTLKAASQLGDKIPDAIKKRLDELNIKVLDDRYTLRDLAFHRFFRPDYLGEIKRINTETKDEVLAHYLATRKNLLIYLAFSSAVVAAVVIFYFRTISR